MKEILSGLGDATIYQFTDHVFNHFLTAVLAIILSGKVTLDEFLEIGILILLVYIALELHKKFSVPAKKEEHTEAK